MPSESGFEVHSPRYGPFLVWARTIKTTPILGHFGPLFGRLSDIHSEVRGHQRAFSHEQTKLVVVSFVWPF